MTTKPIKLGIWQLILLSCRGPYLETCIFNRDVHDVWENLLECQKHFYIGECWSPNNYSVEYSVSISLLEEMKKKKKRQDKNPIVFHSAWPSIWKVTRTGLSHYILQIIFSTQLSFLMFYLNIKTSDVYYNESHQVRAEAFLHHILGYFRCPCEHLNILAFVFSQENYTNHTHLHLLHESDVWVNRT